MVQQVLRILCVSSLKAFIIVVSIIVVECQLVGLNTSEVKMRRRKLSKRGSKRLFRRTAKKTKKKNVLMNLPRGGIQL